MGDFTARDEEIEARGDAGRSKQLILLPTWTRLAFAKRSNLTDNRSHLDSFQFFAMIVCICNTVNDRDIRAAVAAGRDRFDALAFDLDGSSLQRAAR